MAKRLLWALVVTVALAPLPFGSNRPWAWGLLGLAVGALLLLWSAAAVFDRALVQVDWRRYRFAAFAFVALAAWFVVQQSGLTPARWHDALWQEAGTLLGRPLAGAIAIDPAAAREAALRLVTYAGIFLLALQLGREREHASLVLWSVAAAGAVYAVYGLATYLGRYEVVLWVQKRAYIESLTATFINRNSFAAYAGVTLIAALALLRQEAESALRFGLFNRVGFVHTLDTAPPSVYVLIVACVIIATALVLSESRGGFLATAAGVATYALAMRRSRFVSGRANRLSLFALALAFGAIVLVSFSGSGLMGRFGDFAAADSGRGTIYALTLRAIADHPWIGTGLGSFHDVFPMYRDSRLDQANATFDLAHNSYLELALEIGLPALAVMLAALAGIGLACARGVTERQRDQLYPAVGLGVTALLALHSMVDFSLQIPAIAAVYALLLGTGFAQSFPTRDPANGREPRAYGKRYE